MTPKQVVGLGLTTLDGRDETIADELSESNVGEFVEDSPALSAV